MFQVKPYDPSTHVLRIALFIVGVLTLPTLAQARKPTTLEKQLASKIKDQDCAQNPNRDSGCLVTTAGTSSAASRSYPVYAWNKGGKHAVYPHLLREYTALLCQVAFERPSPEGLSRCNAQVEYIVAAAVERPKGAKSRALVWENEDGFASNFVQTEYAKFFFDLAEMYKNYQLNQYPKRSSKKESASYRKYREWLESASKIYLTRSMRLLRAFNFESGPYTGGVRSTARRCGNDTYSRSCWSSYGHNVPDSTGEWSVLNKITVSLRDLAMMVDRMRNTTLVFDAASTGEKGALIEEVTNNVSAIMMHLAFSTGPTRQAPTVAPRLSQYLAFRREPGTGSPFYWFFYSYDRSARSGNMNTSKIRGYHTHVLNTMASLLDLITKRGYWNDNAGVKLATAELLGHVTKKEAEAVGAPDSRFALYQAFRASMNSRDLASVKSKNYVESASAGEPSGEACRFFTEKFYRVYADPDFRFDAGERRNCDGLGASVESDDAAE